MIMVHHPTIQLSKEVHFRGKQPAGTAAAAATSPKISTSTTPIYSVIQTANPISALFEYCKKVKYPGML